MKKAAIIYNSSTGTTQQYAEEIGAYLKQKGLEVQLSSIQEYRSDSQILDGADFVLLGCWTKGLMIIFQHPEKVWKAFAGSLPRVPDVRLGLFTTYQLATGSMFKNMYRHLQEKFAAPALELKSRTGGLSLEDQQALDHFTVSG
jgi:flavodoxin